ncbi:MAG TPA: cob(I)yrinic acid a,c-diamide adenosyltransferase [Blastocatellia bacterium]|nr:cob(I)yrinic acid a,c-diamide adenosyltransferase [Blastocatellia bacterium]
MRITRVYTRKGDKGKTGLVDGSRVSKASPRVEAYGDVDELNSYLGLIRAEQKDPEIEDILRKVQNDLFIVGADLASPMTIEVPRIEKPFIDRLEKITDKLLKELEPLKEFILPGGSTVGSNMHVARCIARRAERRAVELAEAEEINPQVVAYINRLSDMLFVMARVINHRAGQKEESANFRVNPL